MEMFSDQSHQGSIMEKEWKIVRKTVFVLIICGLLLFQAEAVFARERVSVLGFSGAVQEEYIQTAINKLTALLMKIDRFEVVERVEIDRILEEQYLQLTGLVAEDQAVEVGKILGVNLAFIGSINRLAASWDLESKKFRAVAKITIKVIHVESGKILQIMEEEGSGSDRNYRNSLHKAVESSFGSSLAYKIREMFTIYSEVFKVDNGTIYFLDGSREGVKKGMRYYILRPEELELYDWEMGQEFAFKKRLGMIEVVDVLENLSKAKIIWVKETVKPGDILEEIVRTRRAYLKVAPRVTGYEFVGESKKGTITNWEFSFGSELPFHSGVEVVFGGALFEEIGKFDLGIGYNREIKITPGKLYLTCTFDAGFSVASQAEAWSYGFFIEGGGGLKYYFNYGNGIRLELGATGQYGPVFKQWFDENDLDVTDHMPHSHLGFSRFGVWLGLVVPL